MRKANDFRDIVASCMGYIQLLYSRFADKKPVMEVSLPSRKICAYPCSEYMKTLSKRSQELLRKEYRAAVRKNRMVVFVRDNQEMTLKSASFPIECIDHVENDVQKSEGDET